MDAILNCRLECETMSMDKYDPKTDDSPEYFIRHYLHEIEDCIHGKAYDKKMLMWARVNRYALYNWCQSESIPLPEFWFPQGQKTGYEDLDEAQSAPSTPTTEPAAVAPAEKLPRITDDHRAKMACQHVAKLQWRVNPALTKNAIALSDEIQNSVGINVNTGEKYKLKTIEEWLSEVDPRHHSKKRGRKPKNNSGSGKS